MITQAVTATTTIVRKPFGIKTGNALMLGALGVCLAACFSGSRAVHIGAGALFTGLVAHPVYKRRQAL